jgi:hypothetical protein
MAPTRSAPPPTACRWSPACRSQTARGRQSTEVRLRPQHFTSRALEKHRKPHGIDMAASRFGCIIKINKTDKGDFCLGMSMPGWPYRTCRARCRERRVRDSNLGAERLPTVLLAVWTLRGWLSGSTSHQRSRAARCRGAFPSRRASGTTPFLLMGQQWGATETGAVYNSCLIARLVPTMPIRPYLVALTLQSTCHRVLGR